MKECAFRIGWESVGGVVFGVNILQQVCDRGSKRRARHGRLKMTHGWAKRRRKKATEQQKLQTFAKGNNECATYLISSVYRSNFLSMAPTFSMRELPKQNCFSLRGLNDRKVISLVSFCCRSLVPFTASQYTRMVSGRQLIRGERERARMNEQY